MIFFVSFIVGILNGVFASGAGQVLVFYLIYIMKMETHKVRALSIAALSTSSVFAIFGYKQYIDFDFFKIMEFVVITAVMGIIGTKLMKKVPSEILNLISGLLIVGLTIYSFFVKR